MKTIHITPHAPAPIGPYSQAVEANGILYISGQIAIIPETGELIKGSVADETHQVLRNINAILNQANLTFDHVVSCTVYLRDMAHFAEFNEVYATYFNADTAPARATVAVVGLPKNVNVEIGAIAHR